MNKYRGNKKRSFRLAVSASMIDPSSSLTEATRPSEPASKFFIEVPWPEIQENHKYLG